MGNASCFSIELWQQVFHSRQYLPPQRHTCRPRFQRAEAPGDRIFRHETLYVIIRNEPVIISTSSLVIAACRPRLYFICNEEIMSLAFFCALSIALRLKSTNGQREITKRNDISSIPSADLAGVSFNESSINGIRKRKLSQVLCNVILHLVCLESG